MNLLYWHWWVIGLALLRLEMLLPTECVLVLQGFSPIVPRVAARVLPPH